MVVHVMSFPIIACLYGYSVRSASSVFVVAGIGSRVDLFWTKTTL